MSPLDICFLRPGTEVILKPPVIVLGLLVVGAFGFGAGMMTTNFIDGAGYPKPPIIDG